MPRSITALAIVSVAGVLTAGALAWILGPLPSILSGLSTARRCRHYGGDGCDTLSSQPALAGLLAMFAFVVALAVVTGLAVYLVRARYADPEANISRAQWMCWLATGGAELGLAASALPILLDDGPGSAGSARPGLYLASVVALMAVALVPGLLGPRRAVLFGAGCALLAGGAVVWSAYLLLPAGLLLGYAGVMLAAGIAALYAHGEYRADPWLASMRQELS